MRVEDAILKILARLHLPAKGVEYVKRVMTSPPSRAVQSNGRNVCIRFPSRKMGATIQAESHTCELPLIYCLEHDPDVVAFYDQPEPVKISYISAAGRPTSPTITPDFFVIYRDRIELIEAKPEEKMVELAQEKPNRFKRTDDGKWISPPAATTALEYGFNFRIWTPSEVGEVWLKNIKFLGDYSSSDPAAIPDRDHQAVMAAVASAPEGITFQELRAACPQVAVDHLNTLIAHGIVYFDFNSVQLMEQDRVWIFSSQQAAEVHKVIEREKVSAGNQLAGGGSATNDFSKKAQARLAKAVTKDSDRALHADRALKDPAYAAEHKIPDRTLRNWAKKYREGKQIYGEIYGIVGLLPKFHLRGHHGDRFPEEMLALVDASIEKNYCTPSRPKKSYAYEQMRLALADKYPMPSRAWFYQRLAARSKHKDIKARQGKRAAYASEYFNAGQPNTNHGEFPWDVCHVDHTQADVELICSVTGQNLGRPWLSVLLDGFSRKILAMVITFDPPSYRTLMALMVDCVKRHERLPHTLVTDNGKEFKSTYFEQFCGLYEIQLLRRPPAKARYGAIIERVFGTINTQFLHNLPGNTQNMIKVRELVASFNPKGLATWTLGDLISNLEYYAYQNYNRRPHGTLLVAPEEKWANGIEKFGAREQRTVKNDEVFRMMVLPTTSKGTAKVHPGKGVKIHGVYYWAEVMRSPKYENTDVCVKYDPEDLNIAWAFLGQWICCRAADHLKLQGRTEKEIQIATKEFRQAQKLMPHRQASSVKQLAIFMAQTKENKAIALQQAKDREQKDAKILKATPLPPPLEAPAIKAEETKAIEVVPPPPPPMTPTDDYGNF